MSLLVKGRIFAYQGIFEGSILIEDGKIVKVAKEIHERTDEVLDYSGRGYLVLPGLIDMHVHMRDFEFSYKEDFYTGTAAAAAGGFTIVVDMPNTRPKVNTLSMLKERERVAKSKALVDYGLYFGVPDHEVDLIDGIEALTVGFKVFMQHEFYTDKRPLTERMLEFASEKGMLVMAHAENPKFFVESAIGVVGTPEAEVNAIKDISSYALRYRFPLQVTHMSSATGVREVLKWKKRAMITADVCPHHLLLTEDDAQMMGAIAKIHPSLKSRADAEVLLRGLKNGDIDVISSDHAPHSLEEKADLQSAAYGVPGLETTLPLVLTMVNKGLLGLDDVVRTCATNPSKILNLHGAGAIEEGKIGNLTVIDLHRRGKIDPKNFMSKAKYSPFEGREVEGMPVATIVRGQPVMLDGEIVARAGGGVNVKTYG